MTRHVNGLAIWFRTSSKSKNYLKRLWISLDFLHFNLPVEHEAQELSTRTRHENIRKTKLVFKKSDPFKSKANPKYFWQRVNPIPKCKKLSRPVVNLRSSQIILFNFSCLWWVCSPIRFFFDIGLTYNNISYVCIAAGNSIQKQVVLFWQHVKGITW